MEVIEDVVVRCNKAGGVDVVKDVEVRCFDVSGCLVADVDGTGDLSIADDL